MEIVTIRSYRSSDDPFIFSSWRNAVWFDSNKTDKIDSDFYHKKTKEIRQCIEESKVNIASLKSDPDFLVGYAVIKDQVVEFVYVKLDYRKQGIATILCRGLKLGAPITKVGKAILRHKENK
jgi:hypothetical protein